MKNKLFYLIMFLYFLILNKSFAQSPENVVKALESDTSLSENVSINICVISGIALSAFEDQDEVQIAIPLGLLISVKLLPHLEVGAECGFLAKRFKNEFSFGIFGPSTKYTVYSSQTIYGVLGRYIFLSSDYFSPFFRAGLGYYSGSVEIRSEGSKVAEPDLDNVIGYNLGIGTTTEIGLYAEFIFHFVKHKINNASAGRYDTGALYLGYSINLN